MIDCSVNEIEGTARRAARGAGLAWGLAEEAAKAARWLAARKLPCVPLLVGLLRQNDGVPHHELAPLVSDHEWSAAGGRDLCPLIAGTALNDHADRIAAGGAVTLAAVSHPLLLVPFLGRAAAATGQAFELGWPGVAIRCLPDGPAIAAPDPAELTAPRAAPVEVRAAEAAAGDRPTPRRVEGVAVDPDHLAYLKQLALRTYVPASAESRARGAGGDAIDDEG